MNYKEVIRITWLQISPVPVTRSSAIAVWCREVVFSAAYWASQTVVKHRIQLTQTELLKCSDVLLWTVTQSVALFWIAWNGWNHTVTKKTKSIEANFSGMWMRNVLCRLKSPTYTLLRYFIWKWLAVCTWIWTSVYLVVPWIAPLWFT